jgi:UDP-2,4-diacetamido-2,4,6-trideoxy-beta-L-altropyranose hydrolase
MVAMLGVATAALDDVPERALGTAVVLNQNIGIDEDDYRHLVAPASRVLIGPRYALVSHEIRRMLRRPSAATLRVLVSFGGGEHGTLVDDVLTALQRVRVGTDVPHSLDVTVVASDVDGVRWSSAGPHAVHVLPPTPGLAKLMAEADVAIGAPGSTTYERLALGVPSILVQLSDNQRAVARGLVETGAAVVIGRREDVTLDDWVAALRRVCGDSELRGAMATVGPRLVDGHGTERVLDALAGAVAEQSAA